MTNMTVDEKFVGTVIWFDPKKGYGYLAWEKDGVKQKDMFVHFTDIIYEGFKTIVKDQKVSFGIGSSNDGRPKAVEVTVLKH